MSAIHDDAKPPPVSDFVAVGALLVEQGVIPAVRALAARYGVRPAIMGSLPRLPADVELCACLVAEEWLRAGGAVSLDILPRGAAHQLVFAAPDTAPPARLVARLGAVGGTLARMPPDGGSLWLLTLPRSQSQAAAHRSR